MGYQGLYQGSHEGSYQGSVESGSGTDPVVVSPRRMGKLAIVGARFGLLQLFGATMIDLIGPLRVPRGDYVKYRLTVTDDEDERVDLTGSTIELQVKTALGAVDPPLIAKSIGSGITLLTQSGDTKGQADIVLLPADTNITSALYYLDIVLVEAGTQRQHVIEREFTIGGVVNPP